jgi:rhodanese-related sulfurtransferase
MLQHIASSRVTAVPAAAPEAAHDFFSRRLSVETDADDVATAIKSGERDFVLVDARSPEAYESAHLPGAINVPHATIDADLAASLGDGLVVVYCWGPGCNAGVKAAEHFSEHGRQVKEMIGGFEYFVREGHPIEGHDAGLYSPDASGLVGLLPRGACGC